MSYRFYLAISNYNCSGSLLILYLIHIYLSSTIILYVSIVMAFCFSYGSDWIKFGFGLHLHITKVCINLSLDLTLCNAHTSHVSFNFPLRFKTFVTVCETILELDFLCQTVFAAVFGSSFNFSFSLQGESISLLRLARKLWKDFLVCQLYTNVYHWDEIVHFLLHFVSN